MFLQGSGGVVSGLRNLQNDVQKAINRDYMLYHIWKFSVFVLLEVVHPPKKKNRHQKLLSKFICSRKLAELAVVTLASASIFYE